MMALVDLADQIGRPMRQLEGPLAPVGVVAAEVAEVEAEEFSGGVTTAP